MILGFVLAVVSFGVAAKNNVEFRELTQEEYTFVRNWIVSSGGVKYSPNDLLIKDAYITVETNYNGKRRTIDTQLVCMRVNAKNAYGQYGGDWYGTTLNYNRRENRITNNYLVTGVGCPYKTYPGFEVPRNQYDWSRDKEVYYGKE